MICLNCGFENTDGARYCARCGADIIELDWRSARPGTKKWKDYERRGFPMEKHPRATPVAEEFPEAYYSVFVDQNDRQITVSHGIWQDDDLEITLHRERTGEDIVISGNPEVVGKGSRASCRIDGNPAISRTHMNIFREGDRVFVEDMNSSNHTFVNGVRIYSPVEVRNGTGIQLADELFTIHIRTKGQAPDAGGRFCENCGARIEPGNNYCGKCGAKV